MHPTPQSQACWWKNTEGDGSWRVQTESLRWRSQLQCERWVVRWRAEKNLRKLIAEQERVLMPICFSQAEHWLTSLCIFQFLGFLDKNNDLLFRNLKEVREEAQKIPCIKQHQHLIRIVNFYLINCKLLSYFVLLLCLSRLCVCLKTKYSLSVLTEKNLQTRSVRKR